MPGTFILTAELDADSFAWLDGLRREHFPSERNSSAGSPHALSPFVVRADGPPGSHRASGCSRTYLVRRAPAAWLQRLRPGSVLGARQVEGESARCDGRRILASGQPVLAATRHDLEQSDRRRCAAAASSARTRVCSAHRLCHGPACLGVSWRPMEAGPAAAARISWNQVAPREL